MLRAYRIPLTMLSILSFAAGCGVESPWSGEFSRLPPSSAARSTAAMESISSDAMPDRLPPGHNREAYDAIDENPFLAAADHPLSTFAIDVDTASYSNVRRFLRQRNLPPAGAVRIEELVNYFPYSYLPPTDGRPFAVDVEMATCPWNTEHQLARIALKGRELAPEARPPANLVFLVDVSGSMEDRRKLPLVKAALALLVERLEPHDRIGLAVYAGASGLVLPSTPVSNRNIILSSLGQLQAGGSTNGGAGIELAYRVAKQNFIEGGVNRVILCTDGDFNVGVTNQSDLIGLIEEQARSGVFLSVLGFGMGNYQDSTMEKLADRGNGNYAYIDTLAEARKVFLEQLHGTLVTIAKDVKIQVDFNPATVAAYRLIGYENRRLAAEDFADDRKDAGEIGAGHTVTAFYELVPAGLSWQAPPVIPSKYVQPSTVVAAEPADEAMTVRLRWKEPDGEVSQQHDVVVANRVLEFPRATVDFQFASGVVAFGMLLRGSVHAGDASFALVEDLADRSRGTDESGYRREFLELVQVARELHQNQFTFRAESHGPTGPQVH